jgi:hypothetical protein
MSDHGGLRSCVEAVSGTTDVAVLIDHNVEVEPRYLARVVNTFASDEDFFGVSNIDLLCEARAALAQCLEVDKGRQCDSQRRRRTRRDRGGTVGHHAQSPPLGRRRTSLRTQSRSGRT